MIRSSAPGQWHIARLNGCWCNRPRAGRWPGSIRMRRRRWRKSTKSPERSERPRADFVQALRETASDQGIALADTAEFKFRRRYNMPPTDPRFLNATLDDILIDLWAHAHHDDPGLRNSVSDPNFDEELAAMEAEAKIAQSEPKPATKVLGSDDWTTVIDDKYPS